MKAKTIEVVIGQAVPNLAPTMQAAVLDAWRKVSGLLTRKPFSVEDPFTEKLDVYTLVVDFSSLVTILENAAVHNGGFIRFRQGIREHTVSDAIAAVKIELTAKSAPESDLAYYHAAAVALQQIYLCLNIAVPGSCQFVDITFPGDATSSFDPLSLESAPFIDGYLNSIDAGWPVIKPIDVEVVWDWLHALQLSETDTAIFPINKVLFGLLELGHSQSGLKNKNILLICHLLELLTETVLSDSLTQMRRRLELILGSRPEEGDSLSELFRLKQNYIVGARPYRRQALKVHDLEEEAIKQLATHNSPAEAGLAIVIAVLQRLAQANASGFIFEEQLALKIIE